jgi:uncharacterized membrane protein YcaP (DUF421 family)
MDTILRATAGYFILLLVVRVLARRAGSQMTLFEFVLVFLIGGVIILATVGPDRSVTNCTCAVIAVASLHRFVSWAKSRSPRIGAIVDGTPIVIVQGGEWREDVLKGMGVRREDVVAAARMHGIGSSSDIQYAVLERNGGITVMTRI